MINSKEDSHVPFGDAKQVVSELKRDVDLNRQDCNTLKDVIKCMIEAAVSSKSINKCNKPNSIHTSNITFKSATSITLSNEDGEVNALSQPEAAVHNIPGLDAFLDMTVNGELELSDEFLRELYNVNSRVDTVNKACNELQVRWCEVDQKCHELDKSLKALKKEVIADLNRVKQYQMIDNVLFHKFTLPTVQMTSLEFSQYVAEQINILIPQLPVPVQWEHISTAHPLPTKARKSNVVVVRFCNRNIKDMVYKHRNIAYHKGVLITEHLTDFNKSICVKARKLFPSNCIVRTESCKIFIDIDGISHRVASLDDVDKLFVIYCEFVGSYNNYSFTPQPVSYNYCYRPPRNSTVVSAPTRGFIAAHSKDGGTKGKPRKPYYVRNRQY